MAAAKAKPIPTPIVPKVPASSLKKIKEENEKKKNNLNKKSNVTWIYL